MIGLIMVSNHYIFSKWAPRKPQMITNEQRIYNYRLSRAQSCVENAFGILCAKWFCLRKTMFCGPDRAQKIISAACYLHNYFIANHKTTYCSPKFADTYDANGILTQGEWRKALPQDSLYNNNIIGSMIDREPDCAKNIRDELKKYVNSSAGSLSWQRNAVFLD